MTRSALLKISRVLRLEEIPNPEHAGMVNLAAWLIALALAARAFFWAYAQRYWEDSLITCLHSLNFVEGLGLTHVHPGQPPLQGFTSPISVLIPIIGDFIHPGLGPDFLKLASMPAAALTILYLLAFGLHPRVAMPKPLIGMLMGYAAFEHHQIMWGMSGMETQFCILALVMSLYYCVAGRPVALGVSLGICMLARPDLGFWTVIVGLYILCVSPRSLWKTVLVSMAVYGPWLLFTTLYYGSPIPNTIIAKALGYVNPWYYLIHASLYTQIREAAKILFLRINVLLGPAFCGHGSGIHMFYSWRWHNFTAELMFGFALWGVADIIRRRRYVLFPLVGFWLVYTLYYLFLVPFMFPWYMPPFIIMLLLLSAQGLQAAAERFIRQPRRNRVLAGFAVTYLGLFISVLPLTFQTERQIQFDIENAIRKPAGLYLKAHMKPDEAVGSESLGYIGYYSRGNVYDWPGLDSRRVVEWSRSQPPEKRGLEQMLKALQPQYLFLRNIELNHEFKDPGWFKSRYHLVRTFRIDPQKARAIRWLECNTDTYFLLYKRNSPNRSASNSS